MPPGHVKCTHCGAPFPVDGDSTWTEGACPLCKERLQVCAFPALNRPLRFRPGPVSAAAEGQAVCFFHARKPAAVPCDGCGRFLCSLCDFRLQDRHYCATCLDGVRKSGTGPAGESALLLKDRVFLPQNLAFGLAFYSPLTLAGLYLIPVTAPAALWLAIRHWKNADGFQARGKWRFAAAIVLALCQLLGLALATVFLVHVFREAAKT
ncbi:MAG TPA: hypothetical protein VJ385_01345 [Fibrobacteria bacterium]|nr:hypothetical protein [Fibrobacteria bacterium]